MVITVCEIHSNEPIAGVTVTMPGPLVATATTNKNGAATVMANHGERIILSLSETGVNLKPSQHAIYCDKSSISLKVARQLSSIVIKRNSISLTPLNYGHWWVELGPDESYGWWPSKPVSLIETFLGVPGSLNDMGHHAGGSCSRDPHHNEKAEIEFSPLIASSMPVSDVIAKIRDFSQSYKGLWQWILEYGQNCHTFQIELMRDCKLLDPRT